MATTTNYGWTTPDDTALVKDGAAAIRTLGSSVDTTTKALNPSTTLGDIEYRSSTANTNTRLGIGTTGQVLAVSGGVPAWSTISSGGMTLISETVASANSSLSLSSIPGTYKQLLLVWCGIQASTSTSNGFDIRLNNDSGAKYKTATFSAYNSTMANAQFNATSMCADLFYVFGYNASSANLQDQCQGYMTIDNYASTSKYKNVTGFSTYNDIGQTQKKYINWNSTFADTAAITSIDVVRLEGTATFSNSSNTSIRLYGLS
jgi:hypothetical protein